MKFSKQAKQVIDLITKTNDTIFVTGKAGTGKSVLLDHIKSIAKKKIIILAPTGISAINVNGETIHSFFTLKPGFELDEAKSMYMDEKKRSKYKNIQAIAIDEISMVRADLLDAIDTVLKRARKSKDPFGGVQMIFFGDLYQLPPVLTQADRDKFFSNYDSPYFFDANVFKSLSQKNLFSNSELSVFELDKIYRQKDRGFIDILNAVRDGALEDKHLLSLNSRFFPSFEPEEKDNYIHLVTTNAMAATINDSRMKKLNKKEFSFTAVHSGEIARNLHPNDLEIKLCVGAQVMFICNDSDRRWVNGTIGKVISIKSGIDPATSKETCMIKVKKSDGVAVEVVKYTWEISKYTYKRGLFERESIG